MISSEKSATFPDHALSCARFVFRRLVDFGGASAQQLGHLGYRHRPAEVEALGLTATGGHEEAHLCFGLDALGGDLDAEVVGKANGGANDGGLAIVHRHAENEFLCKLQTRDR